ncbi:MAG TPA: PaaI family thioesterase [Solimonas sp.]|nr:PaaI family thioesterase [Solimonas sp.]
MTAQPTTAFHESLRQRFVEMTPHIRECGMTVGRLDAEATIVTLPWREEWLGDTERGLIHPGIVTTLVDSACGAALLAHLGQPEPIATLDLRMDYLRPARRDLPVHCRASCLRLTRSIAFMQALAWQTDEAEPIATAQGAFMRSGKRRPLNELA